MNTLVWVDFLECVWFFQTVELVSQADFKVRWLRLLGKWMSTSSQNDNPWSIDYWICVEWGFNSHVIGSIGKQSCNTWSTCVPIHTAHLSHMYAWMYSRRASHTPWPWMRLSLPSRCYQWFCNSYNRLSLSDKKLRVSYPAVCALCSKAAFPLFWAFGFFSVITVPEYISHCFTFLMRGKKERKLNCWIIISHKKSFTSIWRKILQGKFLIVKIQTFLFNQSFFPAV